MQLTGMQFTSTTALLGNDLSTLRIFRRKSAPPRVLCRVSDFRYTSAHRDQHPGRYLRTSSWP